MKTMTSLYELQSGITFVLGGARSGKSAFCESLLETSGLKPIYLATGRAGDEQMQERIEQHRKRRDNSPGSDWMTVEEPLAVADAIRNSAFADHAILVDCLTLWVTNLMMADANVERECDGLIAALKEVKVPVVLASNEVGLGLIPENKMAREFIDLSGVVHQRIAAMADQVYFVTAGLPLQMKPSS